MVLLQTFQYALDSLYGKGEFDNGAGESVDLLLDSPQPSHLAGVGLRTLRCVPPVFSD